MELRETIYLLICIALQISMVISKKRHKIRTLGDSIENILYYKDCNHKPKEEPMLLRQPVSPPMKQQECKMYCNMCCGDHCVDTRQMDAQRLVPNQRMQMQKPSIQPIKPQKNLEPDLLPPIGSRRDIGVTKEYIKSLISQDVDIRKILKELVNVTMQKVAVMKILSMKDNEIKKTSDESNGSENETEN